MVDPTFGLSSGKGEEQSRELQRIRAFIPPELRDALSTMIGGQTGLTAAVATNAQRGDRIPGLNMDEGTAEMMARKFATGADGTLPMVQSFFGDAVSGQGLQDFSDPAALNRMYQSIAGVGLGEQLPGGAADALQGIAAGDNLYGGEGFDASVKAAVDAALPGISSAFGATRGGLSGALAKESVGRAGVNEALRYQNAEKARQLNAQSLLGNLTGNARRESLGAAGSLLDMSGRERDRSFAAAEALPQLGMLGPTVLSSFGEKRRMNEQMRRQQPYEDLLRGLQALQGNFRLETLLGQDREGTADSSSKESSKGIGF
jgi:hypothetical protein